MWIIDDASTDPNGLRQAGVPVFLYGAGALAAAEALEVLDVRQDDLFAANPLAGKWQHGGTAGEEGQQLRGMHIRRIGSGASCNIK